MVKEPHPGRVKTRLAADIGTVRAAWWFRHQSSQLARRLSRAPRWRTVLAVSPDVEGLESRVWPQPIARVPQGQGNLGTRMARAFQTAGHGPTVIIGADIPAIMPHHIAKAFRALGSHDAVFGPALDGGYWLIGLKNPARLANRVFRNVRWSTEFALADTRANLSGCKTALIDTLRDVDTLDDLGRKDHIR